MAEPFPTDGRVDLERLRLLLDAQTEYPSLDYKRDCDLRSARGKLEFAKDVAGMMSRPQGGYIVVGVDGLAQPVGAPFDAALFDESRLRAMLAKYFEGELVIASQVHSIAGQQVAVLYFGRRPDGLFPIIKGDFSYRDKAGNSVTPLRAGDVFFRDGTQTRRWRSGDLPALLAPYVEEIRRVEREQLGTFLAQVEPRLRGDSAAAGPLAGLTWRLSQEEFDSAVAELSRRQDGAAVRLLALELRRDGVRLIRSVPDSAPELRDLLNRAVSAIAYAIVLADRQLFDRALGALAATFDAGCLDADGRPAHDTVAAMWLDIAARVLALIGLAIRIEEWWAVRPLTLRPVGTAYRRESWLRHALTWGYRTGQVPRGTSGNAMPGALIALARQALAGLPALRLDVGLHDNPPALGQPPAPVDPALDSLCQADLLWCVVAASTGARAAYYPSFGSLYPQRTEPMVDRLLSDDGLVSELMPDQADNDVRSLILAVLRTAESEGRWFGDWTTLIERAGG